jgi:hypothetical protein
MRQIDSYDTLREHVQMLKGHAGDRIASIDGYRQSGKTTLAKRLTDDLNGTCISTDTYRRDELVGRPYVEQLALDDLKGDIVRAHGQGVVLVEGICVSETLTLAGIDPVMRIYCKRMTQSGLWADDLPNYVIDGHVCPDLSPFDTEVARYHVANRPDANADVVFLWDGDSMEEN